MSPATKRRIALVNLVVSLVAVPVVAAVWLADLISTRALVGVTLVLSLMTHAVSSWDWYTTADVRVGQEEGERGEGG